MCRRSPRGPRRVSLAGSDPRGGSHGREPCAQRHGDEQVADLFGLNVKGLQVCAFTLGGFLAGLGGGLWAHHFSIIEAQNYNVLLSIYIVLYVLLGGTQTVFGPIVGAAVFTLTPELLREIRAMRYEPVAEAAAPVAETAQDVLAPIGEAAAPVVQAAADAVAPVVDAVQPLVTAVSGAAEPVAETAKVSLFSVRYTVRSRSPTSSIRAMKSGSRWPSTGREYASITSGYGLHGPGPMRTGSRWLMATDCNGASSTGFRGLFPSATPL